MNLLNEEPLISAPGVHSCHFRLISLLLPLSRKAEKLASVGFINTHIKLGLGAVSQESISYASNGSDKILHQNRFSVFFHASDKWMEYSQL